MYTGSCLVAICPGQDSEIALAEAGYHPRNIISWKAHPSLVFHPSRFVEEKVVSWTELFPSVIDAIHWHEYVEARDEEAADHR